MEQNASKRNRWNGIRWGGTGSVPVFVPLKHRARGALLVFRQNGTGISKNALYIFIPSVEFSHEAFGEIPVPLLYNLIEYRYIGGFTGTKPGTKPGTARNSCSTLFQ